MTAPSAAAPACFEIPRVRWMRGLRFAALAVFAALTPTTYDPAVRRATAQALCTAAWRSMPVYALFSVLLGAVLTQVVATTAASYNLSHLALEAMVRVFVVELLPLAAALFVAVRSGLATMAQLIEEGGVLSAERLRMAIVPALASNAFAVMAFALVSGILTLAVAYPVVHGFTPWAFAGYMRLIGQVFDPVTASVLAWKLLMLGLLVGLLPTTVALLPPQARRTRQTGAEVRVMAVLLFGLVLIEAASLAVLQI